MWSVSMTTTATRQYHEFIHGPTRSASLIVKMAQYAATSLSREVAISINAAHGPANIAPENTHAATLA
jgi:hypothetical protein